MDFKSLLAVVKVIMMVVVMESFVFGGYGLEGKDTIYRYLEGAYNRVRREGGYRETEFDECVGTERFI